MKKLFVLISILFLVSFRSGTLSPRSDWQLSRQRNHPNLEISPDFGNVPLYFTLNKGQVHEKALYFAKTSKYTLWMTKGGLVFDSSRKLGSNTKGYEGNDELQSKRGPREDAKPEEYERDVTRLIFQNANENPEVVPLELTEHRVNYFIGNNKSKWKKNIPTSKRVLYKDLYKNIDLKIYGVEKQIEYDWIVKPEGNPEDIIFAYKDTDGTEINAAGDLLVKTEFGELIHKKPVSYQVVEGDRVDVESCFKRIGEDTYGFKVGAYDKNCELVVDPVVLVYSTYLGGTNDEYVQGIAVDSSGNVYVTGNTDSADFPTQNPYQTDQGGTDVFVMKLSSAGNSLAYSTYLGGSSSDNGLGIAVDSSGNAYVTGYTESTDFPTQNPYQTDQGVEDAFVTKLSSAGNSLAYSTYLGGSNYDRAYGVVVDNSGNAYVTGYTESTDFPTQNPYQGSFGGGYTDAFVTKLSSAGSSLVYSTYLGGSGDDYAYAIAVDSSGNAYVTGTTYSTDFPTQNPYQTDQDDYDIDVFVTKLSSAGNSLIYSTYLGGSSSDNGLGIAVDSSGNAYVTGTTYSTDFPTQNPFQSDQSGCDVFVTKLTSAGNSLVYSTYLGGSSSDDGSGIAVDSFGNAYVTGETDSTDFPTQNPYQTDQDDYDFDVFVTKLSSVGNSLVYSTYLGGSDWDFGLGIAVDSSGNAYVTGNTSSTDFPTQNPYQPDQGNTDAFVTKLFFGEKDDLLGTWTGQGVYYRNSDTGMWTKLGSSADKITAGDLDNDGIDDLIGIWPSQGGVWVKYSDTGCWAKLSTTADWIGAGDMNGDGRDDLLGTWAGQGVYYRDSVTTNWIKMASAADKTASGDLDGDGTDDLIGIWPSQGGIWVKYSSTSTWELLSITAGWIACGDMSGDGLGDLLGVWPGQGVYYRDTATGTWYKMASSASQITCGDLDGDGIDDLVGMWAGQDGVWVKYSSDCSWEKLSSTADWIACGKMRDSGTTSAVGDATALGGLKDQIGGLAEIPFISDSKNDASAKGPGGSHFIFSEQPNLFPLLNRNSKSKYVPGPGEPGFECVEQSNLIPGKHKKKSGRKDK